MYSIIKKRDVLQHIYLMKAILLCDIKSVYILHHTQQ